MEQKGVRFYCLYRFAYFSYWDDSMEQKGVRFYCLYRFAYFSYWDDSYNTDSSSYGDVSGFIRWNNRGYLFSLRRIYGSGKSKKMFTDK